jgi:amino acid permease
MKKLQVGVLVLLAILSVAVAIVYFSKTAGSLPHFFPGYAHGSAHKHVKHGLAFIGLTVVFLLGAWMLGGHAVNDDASK